ncbi:hypothetical protein [Streptomyces sp. NPDC001404]|uniref:hypothetical protein n=1 Tax=Streptomyces sp. NPDC001404 TaxID=3364571 RepID=UPI00367E4876
MNIRWIKPMSRGRHRGMSTSQLRAEAERLENHCARLTCRLVAETSANQELMLHLDRAGIDYSGALEDKKTAEQEVARLQAALTATQAALANANKIYDLPQHTDTMPLDVTELRQRFTAGPVVTLPFSPLAVTDPGQIPVFARPGETAQDGPRPASRTTV